MVFFGFMVNYMLRVNMTIAIVAMVQDNFTSIADNFTDLNSTVIQVNTLLNFIYFSN